MSNLLFDYGGALDKAESFDHGLDILLEITQSLGFTQVLYAYQPVAPRLPDGQWVPLKLNVRNFPRGWEHGWTRFEVHDPYYHACFDGTLPFDWHDVQRREGLNPAEREAWHYLADFGLGRGMTIPIHLPGGRFAVISAILDKTGANWDFIFEHSHETMFHLTHLFHSMIHKKGLEDQIRVALPVKLSPREKECLRWAAGGKTSPEIAIIVDRSVETVRLHMKNAMNKLNAHTRAHAIAKAAQLGLLQPDY
jgi:LuxR family transcriptional regulator